MKYCYYCGGKIKRIATSNTNMKFCSCDCLKKCKNKIKSQILKLQTELKRIDKK